ncbi:MAG: hypothetical protein OH340_01455 [Candidatus Parvarchaeota archaeon]|nr:hypothetical protein [Candidatus Rehaiarchaeum fermentans]
MATQNYFENVIKYVNNQSNFFTGQWGLFEEPFRNSFNNDIEKGYLEWLKAVAIYHINERTGSQYWIDKAKRENITEDKIVSANNIKDLINLLGDSDLELLKNEKGYSEFYKPKGFNMSELFKSSSSGTTGHPKTVYHSLQALIVSAINEYTGISAQYNIEELKGKKLLATGPVGAYQQEHKMLAQLLEMEYVDNGFETAGLKLLPQEEVQKRIGSVFAKMHKYLSEGLGLMTSTIETIENLPINLLRNTKVIKASGTRIDSNAIIKLRAQSIFVIPMYGHYAGKSSIGFLEGENIVYYPSYPVTQYLLEGKGRAREKLIVAQPELLLINDEDYVNPYPSNAVFHPIRGVANPARS